MIQKGEKERKHKEEQLNATNETIKSLKEDLKREEILKEEGNQSISSLNEENTYLNKQLAQHKEKSKNL